MRTRLIVAGTACLASQLIVTPAVEATVVTAPANPMDLARALLGIEAGTTGNGLEIISATLNEADGSASSLTGQVGVFTDAPADLGMPSGVVLTTGQREAVSPSTTAPDHVVGTQSPMPADWLSAYDGSVPNPPSEPPSGSIAYDPAMLTLQVRPKGSSIEVDWLLASEEFAQPEPINDVALILLDTTADPPDRVDKNCALLPVSDPDPQSGAATATVRLVDTTQPYYRTDASNTLTGYDGLTRTLHCAAHVVPGEIVTIRFVVWDDLDGRFDTALLLKADSLRSVSPTLTVPTSIRLSALRDGLPTRLTCVVSCSVRLRATLPAKVAKTLGITGTKVGDRVIIGTGKGSLDAAGTRTARVWFSSTVRNKLARAKSDTVTMRVGIVGGASAPVKIRIR